MNFEAAFLVANALTSPISPSVARLADDGGNQEEVVAKSGNAAATIVVTGERLRGSIDTDTPPVASFNAEELSKLGVDSVRALLRALGQRAKGADGSMPINVLNGRMPIKDDEIFSIPIEAFERIELFPEEVALKFGYAPSRKVMNFVTKLRFRALVIEGMAKSSTDGGAFSPSANATYTLIRNERRLNVATRYSRKAQLLQSDRPIIPEPSQDADALHLISLSPQETNWGIGFSLAGPVSPSASTMLSFDVDQKRTTTLTGIPPQLLMPTDPVRTNSTNFQPGAVFGNDLGLKASVSAAGLMEGWGWTASVDARHRVVKTANSSFIESSMIPGNLERSSAHLPRIRSRSELSTLSGKMTANKAIASMPAGELTTTETLSAQWDRAKNVAGSISSSSHVYRSQAAFSTGLHIPIASQNYDAMAFLGDLSVDSTVTMSVVDRFGGFIGGSLSSRWSPARSISLTTSIARTRAAPELYNLATPRVVTENVPFFDFVTGESSLITTISGGDPDLKAETRNNYSVAIELKPFEQRDLSASLRYNSTETHNSVAFPTALTQASQMAFPDLYVRNSSGEISSILYKPVNTYRTRQKDLGLVLQYTGYLGSAAKLEPNALPKERPFIFLSISPTWRLVDEVQASRITRPLDILDGDTLDGAAGRSSLILQGYANITYSGIGLTVTTDWQNRSHINGSEPASNLTFSSLSRTSVEVSARLQDIFRNKKWANQTTIQLNFDNAFNNRPRVTDRNGATPYRYQKWFMDPVGRTIVLKLRKLF